MTIDIISYTDEQYAQLTDEQLLEIRESQLKKNNLIENMENTLQKEKERLVKNGIFTSHIWGMLQTKLAEKLEAEITTLREALLFYLRFSTRAKTEEEENAPYEVDYSLSDEERFAIVKGYYEETYADAEERYLAFKKDPVVSAYLGELYAPLHDHFYVLAYH